MGRESSNAYNPNLTSGALLNGRQNRVRLGISGHTTEEILGPILTVLTRKKYIPAQVPPPCYWPRQNSCKVWLLLGAVQSVPARCTAGGRLTSAPAWLGPWRVRQVLWRKDLLLHQGTVTNATPDGRR